MTVAIVSAPAVPRADRAGAAHLRRMLDGAGYDARAINRALHPLGDDKGDGAPLVDRRELPVHRRRLEGREDALATLIRLFLFGDTIAAGAVEHTLGDASGLVDLGILSEHGDEARATVRLVPHDDLVLASDRSETGGHGHVPGVHRPSVTLAHLTPRRPVALALDVGTGLGIQALLLARHAKQVVATDLSERALGFAEFNAVLNGVTTIEFRHGSFFEPVAGERFDIAVCNPPYVISPVSEFMFRDGGSSRDTVSEQVVRELPTILRTGGTGTTMVSWVVHDDDVCAQPRSWLSGSCCDGVIVHTSSEDALTTAAAWNRDTRADPDAYASRIDEWLEYYRRESIPSLAYGAVVLRRRETHEPWIQELRLPPGRLGPAGAHLERVFAAHDALAAGLGDRLMNARFTLAGGSTMEIAHRLEAGEWRVDQAVLGLGDGLGFRAELDSVALEIVRQLDGSRTLRDLLADVAAGTGVDAEALEEAGVTLVRRMLQLGFVTATDWLAATRT